MNYCVSFIRNRATCIFNMSIHAHDPLEGARRIRGHCSTLDGSDAELFTSMKEIAAWLLPGVHAAAVVNDEEDIFDRVSVQVWNLDPVPRDVPGRALERRSEGGAARREHGAVSRKIAVAGDDGRVAEEAALAERPQLTAEQFENGIMIAIHACTTRKVETDKLLPVILRPGRPLHLFIRMMYIAYSPPISAKFINFLPYFQKSL